MKTSISLILIVAVFFSITALFAQDAKKSSFGIGVEYRTKKMDMDIAQLSPSLPDLDEKYKAFNIEQEYDMPMASLHLGFFDNIDLAFLFGLLNYDLTQGSDDPGYSHDFECDSSNVFGFNGKIAFPITEKIFVGFFFEHFTSELDEIELSSSQPSMSFTSEGIPLVIESITTESMKYHETTLTPMISMKWGKLTPYVGPRFTAAKADMNVTYLIGGRDFERKIKYDPLETWSLVVGVMYSISENFAVNAEVETVENESYKIGLTYIF